MKPLSTRRRRGRRDAVLLRLGVARARNLVSLVLMAAATACATGARTSGDPFGGGSSGARSSAASRQITIEVRNSNFNDATIDARAIGRQQRLGRVSGTRSEEFTMSWSGSAAIYFEVDLLGGARCVTRAIEASAGDMILLVIDSSPRIRADGSSRLCDAQRTR